MGMTTTTHNPQRQTTVLVNGIEYLVSSIHYCMYYVAEGFTGGYTSNLNETVIFDRSGRHQTRYAGDYMAHDEAVKQLRERGFEYFKGLGEL